jgi:hypothetical protein
MEANTENQNTVTLSQPGGAKDINFRLLYDAQPPVEQLKDLYCCEVKQALPPISELRVEYFSNWAPRGTLTGQLCGVDKETGNNAKC